MWGAAVAILVALWLIGMESGLIPNTMVLKNLDSKVAIFIAGFIAGVVGGWMPKLGLHKHLSYGQVIPEVTERDVEIQGRIRVGMSSVIVAWSLGSTVYGWLHA